MIDRKARTLALLSAPFVLGILYIFAAPFLNAEQNNITQTDVANVIHAVAIAPGGTLTQARAFTSLHKTVAQTAQFQCTGTNPHYKVELLVMIDTPLPEGARTGTFVKPELGGDLGTFSDQNPHIVPLFGPLCLAHKLRITELDGVNWLTAEAYEASQ